MATPTRYQRWRLPILNERLGQADEQEPDPDPEDPTDYAASTEGGAVQVGIDVGVPALVQEANDSMGLASPITATFGATPQIGNTLIAVLMSRGTTNVPVTPSGWTRHAEGEVIGAGFDGGRQTFFYKTAGASESVNVTISTSATTKSLYIAEWSGLGAPDDAVEVNNVAATTSMTVGTITPAATRGVLFAGFNQSSRQQTLTMTAGFTESYTDIIDASGPSQVFGYQIEDPFAGPYTATCTSSQSRGYGAYVLSFAAASDEVVWYPAPQANDADTGTSAYSDVAGGPCIRVALFVERLIYRMELDIGQETAGSTVYELYGTDDASFATSTLLGTLTFTATGSYTLDSTVLSWVPTASYQYYELQHVSGGGDEREVYELRLYSSVSSGGGVTDHPLLTGRDSTAQHPASSVTLADGDDWFDLGTDDVEAALAELAAKAIGVDGTHGSMGSTETFDAAIGWHSGTLTANCTFTLTAAPSGTASSLFLELAQDGTGGWTITLPASVVNKADIEAEQDTTASETTFLVLVSRDGGTSWYGGWWGGAGGGVAAWTSRTRARRYPPTATTLDFTGAGVAAYGHGYHQDHQHPRRCRVPDQGQLTTRHKRTAGDYTINSTTMANRDTADTVATYQHSAARRGAGRLLLAWCSEATTASLRRGVHRDGLVRRLLGHVRAARPTSASAHGSAPRARPISLRVTIALVGDIGSAHDDAARVPQRIDGDAQGAARSSAYARVLVGEEHC